MKRTNLYLDPEKLRALKMLAVGEDSSVSDLVREAIDAIIVTRLSKGGRPLSETGSARALLENVLRRVDAQRPSDISDEDIARDVAEASAEVRAERRVKRRLPVGKE